MRNFVVARYKKIIPKKQFNNLIKVENYENLQKMKKKITVEEVLSKATELIVIITKEAIKADAPKIFIKHLANAANEINESLEIWRYYNDNTGSN